MSGYIEGRTLHLTRLPEAPTSTRKDQDAKILPYTVDELKSFCRDLHLPISGTKAELCQRLRHSVETAQVEEKHYNLSAILTTYLYVLPTVLLPIIEQYAQLQPWEVRLGPRTLIINNGQLYQCYSRHSPFNLVEANRCSSNRFYELDLQVVHRMIGTIATWSYWTAEELQGLRWLGQSSNGKTKDLIIIEVETAGFTTRYWCTIPYYKRYKLLPLLESLLKRCSKYDIRGKLRD